MADYPPQALKEAAMAAYHSGRGDAAELLAKALAQQPNDSELLIADASARALAGEGDALDRITAMLESAPDWVAGHKAMAQLKAMLGLPDPFSMIEAALIKEPHDAQLTIAYLGLLGGAGRYEDAAQKAAQLRSKIGDVPGLRLIEARFAGFAGRYQDAQALLDGLPENAQELDYELARNSMRLGDFERASTAIDRAIATDRKDIGIWALAELCWRVTKDQRHEWLYCGNTMIGQFALDLSADILGDLTGTLRQLHSMRSAPLGQSVEGGTQTMDDLRLREEPSIAQLFAAIQVVLDQYAQGLAGLPSDHPMSKLAQRAPNITASWSIRLTAGGRHFPHLHNSGLVSSAVHLALPEGLKPGEGELELGRPPEDIPHAIEPVATFAPKPAHLVLFPSFLYHGTSRFSEGERLTVAFDAA